MKEFCIKKKWLLGIVSLWMYIDERIEDEDLAKELGYKFKVQIIFRILGIQIFSYIGHQNDLGILFINDREYPISLNETKFTSIF